MSVIASEPRLAPRERETARARAHDPAAAGTLRLRAERLVDRGEMGEAEDLATLAANLAPDDPESWRLLAKMHSVAGRGDDHVSSVR